MNCPNEHGEMVLKTSTKEVTFRNKLIKYPARNYVCPKCGIEADDIALAAENQRKISDAYRKAAKLLTSEQIVNGRKKLKWSQEQLAKAMNVGIASVKRWETGQIQTKPMDDILRRVLSGDAPMGDLYTGNRSLSLPRIKLVLNRFTDLLGREMLKEDPNDKLLYEAKYLWYADMIAYRETGQSMTGATYARLPQGPQLNNYKDLIPMIRKSNESKADPLTDYELRIISRVAAVFPDNQKIYRAAHKEKAYTNRTDGELIPYNDAESIKAL
jgi:putative zinc finger/helix-turn-helix YgiT family protein